MSDQIQTKVSAIFSIIVEKKQTGIKQCDILKVLHDRGVSKKRVGSTDYIAMLDNAGYLVWLDDHGKLHPYKNLNKIGRAHV